MSSRAVIERTITREVLVKALVNSRKHSLNISEVMDIAFPPEPREWEVVICEGNLCMDCGKSGSNKRCSTASEPFFVREVLKDERA